MDQVNDSVPRRVSDQFPVFVEDIATVLHPRKCPDRGDFNTRLVRLLEAACDAGTCGSELINKTNESEFARQRQALINELWDLREANNVSSMLDSQLFAGMTKSALSSDIASLADLFATNYCNQVLVPVYQAVGEANLLGMDYSTRLMKVRTQCLDAVEAESTQHTILGAIEGLGPLYQLYIVPAITENVNTIKPHLANKSKDEILSAFHAVIRFLSEWPTSTMPETELAEILCIAYGFSLSHMPEKIFELISSKAEVKEFMDKHAVDDVVDCARIAIIHALAEWRAALSVDRQP